LIDFDVLLDRPSGADDPSAMPSWSDFEAAAPELAARVRERLDAHTHKTLATVRRDGAPRISGIETQFKDGELWIGSMWQGVKALDLQRDPRFALHSGSDEPSAWKGDAKLAGIAEEVPQPETKGERSHRFRLDLREVSTVGLDDARKHLLIDVWTPDGGVRRIKRA
jgi:Pyridoxamine 5'-phosphate oxidase